MKFAYITGFLLVIGMSACQKDNGTAPTSAQYAPASSLSEAAPSAPVKINTSSFSFTRQTEGQTAHNLKKPTSTVRQYLAYLPKGYNTDAAKKWPVVLNLPGSSETGNDINSIFWTYFAWKTIDKKYPYILITPQLQQGHDSWSSADLIAVLQEVAGTYSIDPERIVVTGYSLGASGAWKLAEYAPSVIAGLLPISGWGDVSKADSLKNTPIWAFHGEADATVNPNFTINMVEAVKEAGGKDAKLTLYPGKGHDVGSITYDNPAVIQWILAQKR